MSNELFDFGSSFTLARNAWTVQLYEMWNDANVRKISVMASLKLLTLVLAAQTSVSTSLSAPKIFAALTAHEQESYSFDDYATEFNLEYAAGEEAAELQRKFERNKAMILAHNKEQRSWKMAVNKFAHMDAKEFKE